MHDGQLFPLQNLAGLNAGMIRPGTNGIELDVRGPMAQGRPAITSPLVGQSDVVVGIAVVGHQLNGGGVSCDGLG